MADLTVKRHDTWPPIKGSASTGGTLIDLTVAESVTIFMKSGGTLISGTVEVLDPPEANPEGGLDFNWQYTWQTGDTDTAGSYATELQILWDSGTSPDEIQTIPNSGTLTLVLEADQG